MSSVAVALSLISGEVDNPIDCDLEGPAERLRGEDDDFIVYCDCDVRNRDATWSFDFAIELSILLRKSFADSSGYSGVLLLLVAAAVALRDTFKREREVFDPLSRVKLILALDDDDAIVKGISSDEL